LDNPSFFQLSRSAPGAIQPVDGGLGRLLVGFQKSRGQIQPSGQGARRTQALETVDQLVAILAPADHQRR